MRETRSRLRALFRRRTIDAELREELDAHLQMEIDANLERGLTSTEALARARRAVGNRTLIGESASEAWTFDVETVVRDLRFGLRLLRRSPGFALTAVLIIGLGIGGTTTAFTLLDHVLLRPLAFADPDRLVVLHQTDLDQGGTRELGSPANVLDWSAMSGSFESMGAYLPAPISVNLSGQGPPMRLDTSLVTTNLFRVLAVQPAAGRAFTADDERENAPPIAVLSHGLAMALFGSPGEAVGRTLNLDNRAHTVVGVMPAGFVFPRSDVPLWRPIRLAAPALLANRSNHILLAVARLRPGVSIDDARAELEVIAARLQRAYPKDNGTAGIAVITLRGLMSAESRTLVIAIFAASFCLLLIACTNLANLLFARGIVRRTEMAVRAALGAGRVRLLRQLLTEGLVLGGIGGALGAGLAATSAPVLSRLVPSGLPIGDVPAMDVRVFAFAAIVTLATCVAFGVIPALRSTRGPDPQALRTRRGGGAGGRLRGALVLAEVAGTVTLLVAAGLLLKALWRVQAIDPGFRDEGVLTLRTALPAPKYSDGARRRDFYGRVLDGARTLPGVTSAAYVSYHPMERFSGGADVLAPGVADDPLTAPSATLHFVTADFFTALGIPVVRGRSVMDGDVAASQPVVVISESLGERLWPGEDPTGRTVNVAGRRTVVGVAGTIRTRSLEGARAYQVYLPADQMGDTNIYYAPKDLMVRSSGDATALAPALRRIIGDVDPEQAVSNVRLLEEIVSAETAPRRTQLFVLATFAAGLAMVMTLVSSLHPALRAAVTNPATTIRAE